MNRSPLTARLWHGALALIVFASLVTQIVLSARGAPDPNGIVQPVVTRFVRLFSYFTIQSNILVLLCAATLALDHGRDGRIWRIVRLDAMLGIVITGLVYATVLAGTVHPTGAGWWTNFGFHYLAPWWALLGWLVFGPRPRIDGRTLVWAVLWPLLWIGFTLAHGAVTHWYPYPFVDVGDIGYLAAVRNLLFIVVIAVLFGVLLRALDHRLPTPTTAPPTVEPPAVDPTHATEPTSAAKPAPTEPISTTSEPAPVEPPAVPTSAAEPAPAEPIPATTEPAPVEPPAVEPTYATEPIAAAEPAPVESTPTAEPAPKQRTPSSIRGTGAGQKQ